MAKVNALLFSVVCTLLVTLLWVSIAFASTNKKLKEYENYIYEDDVVVYEVIGQAFTDNGVHYLLWDEDRDLAFTIKSRTIMTIGDECVIIDGAVYLVE